MSTAPIIKRRPASRNAGTLTEADRVPGSRRLRALEDRRTAILDAALATFSRYGLHGTRLEQVADLADVSKTNLLYHFSSKEELYLAVLRRLLDGWLAPLQALDGAQDPREAIRHYIRQKLLFSRAQPHASRLFCLEIVQGAPLLRDELNGALRQIVDAKSQVIESWIEQGLLAPIDPRHLIFSLWATTQHYADFAVQVEALSDRTLADEAFLEETISNVQNIILNGILPRPAP